MDAELKRILSLLRNKGALVNGVPISESFLSTTDSLENIRDELVVADAVIDAVQVDVGDASASTLGSLYSILGNPAQTFLAMVGYEGALALANKLTAARAALLDQITALRMAELDAANLPADIDTLLARLTAARAGYLDELAAANLPADIDTLLARLTALRAGYLDELGAANLPADIDTLLARLTALRAGYLDNLSGGAVALAASWTAALATALGNYTAARAGYLDNINQAGLLQVTAARAALLDQITALRLAELDAANLPADVDTLLARLTALRAGYLDELDFDLNARLGAPAGASLAADIANISGALGADVDLTGAVDAGTTASSIVDAERTEATNDALVGRMLIMTSGVTLGEVSEIVDFVAATDTLQIFPPLTQAPGLGATYRIISRNSQFGRLANTSGISGYDPSTDSLQAIRDRFDVLIGVPAGASIAADLVVIDDFVDTLEAAVGAIEGATTLHNKLTAARAALLDQITALRLAELDAANLPADVDLIKGYTDSLEGAVGAIEGATTLHNKLTAARATLLDGLTALRLAELDVANLPADIDTLLARLTAVRAGYLDELAAANIPADVDTLLARLTALRAGYLDNLSAGAVALAATALSTATWTAARAGYLDELAAANVPADVDTLLARLTALRAGYLDNINQAGLLSLTAARASYLDNINQAGLLSVTAARATNLDFLDTAETVATFSHPNDVTEDTVFTSAFGGLRTQVLSIWLDMVNHTQTQTIRVKCAIDGINYRTFSTLTWLATDDPGVLVVPFAANQDIRVTVQSSVLEGAARDLPYTLVTRTVE